MGSLAKIPQIASHHGTRSPLSSLTRVLRRVTLTSNAETRSSSDCFTMTAPSRNPRKQRLDLAVLQRRHHAQIIDLARVDPHVLVAHRLPRLREVETPVDRFR